MLVAIDALRALGRWDEALAALRRATSTRFPSGPRRAEALFKKAEATGEGAAPARDGAPAAPRR